MTGLICPSSHPVWALQQAVDGSGAVVIVAYTDAEKLLLKISSHRPLTDEELEDVASLLQSVDPARLRRESFIEDAYGLLLVLGRANAVQYGHILERYLDIKDPLTVSLVLEILCLSWNRLDEFLERVIDFSLGSGWDEDEDVRHTALRILGEYLRTLVPPYERGASECANGQSADDTDELPHRVRQVIKMLLNTFEDRGATESTRGAAYLALGRAAGKEWEELPGEWELIDGSSGGTSVDGELLGYLRNFISSS